MKLRALVVAGAVACGLVVAAPAGASANIMWCTGDPPVQVLTPTGTRFVVNTYVYADAPHTGLHGQTQVSVTTAPDGAGGTLVTVHAYPPPGQYVTVVAAVQRGQGTLSTQASGRNHLILVIDVPIA